MHVRASRENFSISAREKPWFSSGASGGGALLFFLLFIYLPACEISTRERKTCGGLEEFRLRQVDAVSFICLSDVFVANEGFGNIILYDFDRMYIKEAFASKNVKKMTIRGNVSFFFTPTPFN